MPAFVDVEIDGDKLDNATAEVVEAALAACAEMARDVGCDAEDIATNVLWNALLSLSSGEAFIKSMTEYTPSLSIPAPKRGGN